MAGKLTRKQIDAGVRGLSDARAILDGAKPRPEPLPPLVIEPEPPQLDLETPPEEPEPVDDWTTTRRDLQ